MARCFHVVNGGVVTALCLSYAVFLANVNLSLTVSKLIWVPYLYGVEFVGMVVMLLLRWRVRQDESSPLSMTKFVRWLPHVVCAFISGIYILIVGPYLEVPADVWQHLGAIQDYKRRYEFGIIDSNQPWYLIYTMALSLSGEKIYQTVEAFTIAGNLARGLGATPSAEVANANVGVAPVAKSTSNQRSALTPTAGIMTSRSVTTHSTP